MKKIIIFCQAPADIQYALTIYERKKNTSKISIFCINVERMSKFLSMLNLKVDNIVFIPYLKNFSQKKPHTIIKEKLRVKYIYNKYFKNIRNSKIYFFSHFCDWITFSFLVKLHKKNEIIFIDHYDSASISNFRNRKNNLKDSIILLLYKYITGIKFNFLEMEGIKKLEFPYEKYGIKRIKSINVDKKIYEKYSYKIDSSQGNMILFFESDHSRNKTIKNYNEKIIEIIKELKNKGCKIYLKPHPRLGFSKSLKKYIFKIVPDFIPGEFINIRNFNAVLGIETTALTSFAKRRYNNVYSLINLFNFSQKTQKENYKKYLNSLSGGKIKFIDSLDNLYNDIISKSEVIENEIDNV